MKRQMVLECHVEEAMPETFSLKLRTLHDRSFLNGQMLAETLRCPTLTKKKMSKQSKSSSNYCPRTSHVILGKEIIHPENGILNKFSH